MKRKLPNKHHRFAFARIPVDGGVTYRLFRRDLTNRIHFAQITLGEGMDRMQFACALWRLRKELRERVDEIEFRLLGVVA